MEEIKKTNDNGWFEEKSDEDIKEKLRKTAVCINEDSLVRHWIYTVFSIVEYFMWLKNWNFNYYIEFGWKIAYSCDIETKDDLYNALFWMTELEYKEWYKNKILDSVRWTKRNIVDTLKK